MYISKDKTKLSISDGKMLLKLIILIVNFLKILEKLNENFYNYKHMEVISLTYFLSLTLNGRVISVERVISMQ